MPSLACRAVAQAGRYSAPGATTFSRSQAHSLPVQLLSASHISVCQLLLALAVQIPVQVALEQPREGSWHLDIKAGVGDARLHPARHLLHDAERTSPLKQH